MIKDLLEQREHLFNVAELMYGDMFLYQDEFWESDICTQLHTLENRLNNLGHQFPIPGPAIQVFANAVAWTKLHKK